MRRVGRPDARVTRDATRSPSFLFATNHAQDSGRPARRTPTARNRRTRQPGGPGITYSTQHNCRSTSQFGITDTLPPPLPSVGIPLRHIDFPCLLVNPSHLPRVQRVKSPHRYRIDSLPRASRCSLWSPHSRWSGVRNYGQASESNRYGANDRWRQTRRRQRVLQKPELGCSSRAAIQTPRQRPPRHIRRVHELRSDREVDAHRNFSSSRVTQDADTPPLPRHDHTRPLNTTRASDEHRPRVSRAPCADQRSADRRWQTST